MPISRSLKASDARSQVYRFLLAALSLALLLAGVSASHPSQQKPADQDDTVRLHSDLVVLTVTVTDAAGQYAHGLKGKDFTVFEDGAQQTVTSFFAEESPFAAAILMDMSASMETKFGMVRAAAASFIDHIREDDQVAVYGFNNKVKLFQEFTNTRDISEYVWEAEAEGNTRLYDCMSEAIDALIRREEKRRAVLLISDGWDSSSHKATLDSVMKKAHGAGVIVYTIDLIDNNMLMGSTKEVMFLRRGRKEMQEFADQTGGRYIHSPQGDKLEEGFTNIVDELRNQYTLVYYSTNQKRDGRWRKLSVATARQGLSTRSRRGYYAPKG
jgi:Ca-activated chloride channel homolog